MGLRQLILIIVTVVLGACNFNTKTMNKKEQVKSFTIIGISIQTTNENGKSMTDIGQLWDRFYSENILAEIPGKIDNDIYAIYTDYESDYRGKYTVILGCKVTSLASVPAGFEGREFKGGNYLKYTAEGKIPDAVVSKWQEIWRKDDKLNRAYTADFEVYGEKSQNPESAEVDIYIATK